MNAGQHADQKNSRFVRKIINLIVMVALIFGLSYLFREFVIQGYTIPSGSMETTIMTGDTVFSEKVSYYGRNIEPGDIITFDDPDIAGRSLIKRCIATAGQTVDMKDGILYLDGVAQNESYVHGEPSYPLSNTHFTSGYPYTIPADMIWVMGDNRTNSQDSRYFGPIPTSSVHGHAFMIYWPLDHFGLLQ